MIQKLKDKNGDTGKVLDCVSCPEPRWFTEIRINPDVVKLPKSNSIWGLLENNCGGEVVGCA